ncbi:DUF4296 domain-containing protein [Neptunitalea lumnitzerae]|uniref:Lipoprotein n=1 Tax=Neptunitalea lumnitzerae TaxID=2965509 RepID=A0ABQ5MGE8_9FLAO|nr:DUF4296 domain-containing protein [Neptunitalea sp. Y10]GLB48495.1 lipoprotein precursor [Neptunitalea sp. Y10]
MKKILLLLVCCGIGFVSCKQNLVDEPDDLIPANTMEKIIYDLSMLNALKAVESDVLEKNNIDAQQYLFEKYKIDSLQFANSSVYYASKNPEEYGKMYERVKFRIEKQLDIVKDSIDLARRKQNIKTDKNEKK